MSTEDHLSLDELRQLGVRLSGSGRQVRVSRYARLHGADRITLGDNVRIDDFAILSAGGGAIRLDDHIHVASHCCLYGGGGIVMGRFTGLSARVTVYSQTDDFSGDCMCHPVVDEDLRRVRKQAVTLNPFSIVGASSTLMPGVELGEGAAVGAHSFVTQSCADWTVSAGVPARRIGSRACGQVNLAKEFVQRWEAP